jgi:hypothetical protein
MDEKNELGAIGDVLRLWRAREALRLAELRLKGQVDALGGFMTRASAILGWIVAIGCLVTAGLLQFPGDTRVLAGVFMAIPLALAALCGAVVMQPRTWSELGYAPGVILDSELGSEREEIESMVLGYALGIAANDLALRSIATTMRAAYWLFAIAPFMGAAGLVFSWACGSA